MNHRPTNHQLTCLSAVKAMFLALWVFGLWGMGQEARAEVDISKCFENGGAEFLCTRAQENVNFS